MVFVDGPAVRKPISVVGRRLCSRGDSVGSHIISFHSLWVYAYVDGVTALTVRTQ